MSSGLGSIGNNANPDDEFAAVKMPGYNASKGGGDDADGGLCRSAACAKILVNAADPGFAATDLNGHRGHRTVEQGPAIAIRLATLPDDGLTGGLFDDAGAVPW